MCVRSASCGNWEVCMQHARLSGYAVRIQRCDGMRVASVSGMRGWMSARFRDFQLCHWHVIHEAKLVSVPLF